MSERDAEISDDDRLAMYARDLAEGIDRSLASWAARCVERIAGSYFGSVSADLERAGSLAGELAREDLMPEIRALLEADVDEQRTTPLAILRRAVPYPTQVLHEAGVPPVRRDPIATEQFPDDDYDLTPAGFTDIDPSLHEPGLVWGAAKAHVHMRRHKRS